MEDEKLKAIYEDQRKEIEYRRNQEFQVFTWTSTILLTIIGAMLATGAKENPILKHGSNGTFLALITIILFSLYSAIWQQRQRNRIKAHQQLLASIAILRGWFDIVGPDGKSSLIPDKWRESGTRNHHIPGGSGTITLTILLCIAACAAVVINSPI